jgi:hypothetical protein
MATVDRDPQGTMVIGQCPCRIRRRLRLTNATGTCASPALLAANFLSTLRVAHQIWLEPPPRTLPRLVREALALTAENFS